MNRTVAILVLLAAGCGGGGGGPTGFSDLSGRLGLPAGAPLRAAPPQVVASQSIASARLAGGPAEGRLEQGQLAVFRYVAGEARTLTARVVTDGFDAEVVLFNLSKGVAARSLVVAANDVYDVVVRARGGVGAYRVELTDEPGDARPATPPEGYLRLGHGQAPGEIVAAPAPGVSVEQLAAAMGAELIDGDERACLLRLPGAPRADGMGELCRLLSSCARLQADGLVSFAEPNHLRRLSQTPNDPFLAQQWALEQTRVLAAWTVATGGGVVVGVVDSGVKAGHPEMAGIVDGGYDFVDDDADPNDPTPDLAHGTSTAGIIAAAANNGQGVAGINWSARIVACRCFDSGGFGTAFRIAQGILFAAGQPNTSGAVADPPAQVVNLSFAADNPTTVEQNACDAARAAGVFLVAAGGNDGNTVPQYPAAYDSVVGVAATAKNGNRAGYSSTGTWIELSAPGGTAVDGILAPGVDLGGGFGYVTPSGTSFAAPHVAGVAALVLGVAALDVDQLEQLLFDSAQDIGTPGYDTLTGHGLVNAYAAVVAATGGQPATLIPGETVHVRLIQVVTGGVVFSATTTEAAALAWAIPGVGQGEYYLVAGTDRDFDGDVEDAGEVGGRWTDGTGSDILRVVGGTNLPNLDFVIAPK